jgi:hypothetical protein
MKKECEPQRAQRTQREILDCRFRIGDCGLQMLTSSTVNRDSSIFFKANTSITYDSMYWTVSNQQS